MIRDGLESLDNSKKLFLEIDKVSLHLEEKKMDLAKSEKQLKNRETQIEAERKKIRTLQKMQEKEAFDRKRRELDGKIETKHKIESEIETLRSDIKMMKRKGVFDQDKNMDAIHQQLMEKEEALSESLENNKVLTIRERQLNQELQDARNELIDTLRDGTSRDSIGVKIMGELDRKPFIAAMKRKFTGDEADVKALELCSLWEGYLTDPRFYPFKIITDKEGNSKEILDLHNLKLKSLKKEYGEKVSDAVSRALLEMNEYNASGRYVVPELWNFGENRKATLKEVVLHMKNTWKMPNKRKRTVMQNKSNGVKSTTNK
ncbi:hypothetical protein Q3G72_000105 [Acer saccharum]|nr:hypothetical protein Q3G72_000105 [Acer saccharum]